MKTPNLCCTGFSRRGVTLVECIVAGAVMLIGLGGLLAINSHQMRAVRNSSEANTATLALQERIEQARIRSWPQLTDGTKLVDLLAEDSQSSNRLDQVVETITVSAYPEPDAAHAIEDLKVQKTSGGIVVVTDPDTGAVLDGIGGLGGKLTDQKTAKVVFDLRWKGLDGKDFNRQTIAYMTNGGISKIYLPSWGTGGAFPPPPPEAGDPPVVPPVVIVPPPVVPPPADPPGNGNGRGSSHGKGGKG